MRNVENHGITATAYQSKCSPESNSIIFVVHVLTKQQFEGAAESHFYVPLTRGSTFFSIVQMKFADCNLRMVC